MRITVSGLPGAGDTSLSEDLARKLRYKTVRVGEAVKDLAKKRGFSIGKEGDASAFLGKMGARERDSFNRALDKTQKRRANGNCIVNGRVSAFNIPDADLKIFLTADENVRARRVAKRDGISIKNALKEIRSREMMEREMFGRMYGFDYAKDLGAYDLVINTSDHKRNDTRDMVLIHIKALKRRK